MQHHAYSIQKLPLLFCGATLLAACSAAETPNSTIETPKLESVDGAAVDEFVAKIVSATNSGELCPTVPWDADENGFADNIQLSSTNDTIGIIFGMGFGPALYECGTPEPASYSRDLSANPSCTVTLELEVPAGVRMGVPRAMWHGYSRDPSAPITATRSYAFENGAMTSTPSSALAEDFVLSDRSQPAYSPTCSGVQTVRLTAKFQAALASPSSVLALDAAEFVTSWRRGTDFKQGCSSDELVSAAPAAAGEWCGGYHARTCSAGLECDLNESYSVNGNTAGAEGTCVDPSQRGGVVEIGEPCDGFTKIQCPADAVCWHKSDAPPNWLGRCVRTVAEEHDPCHTGHPSLECGAPFICFETKHFCVEARGETGDACGQPNLPSCVYPNVCGEDSGQCAGPSGRGGDPCGSPDLPDCESPAYCENQRCVDPRGKVGETCGDVTLGCRPKLACINHVCAQMPEPTCVTPEGR